MSLALTPTTLQLEQNTSPRRWPPSLDGDVDVDGDGDGHSQESKIIRSPPAPGVSKRQWRLSGNSNMEGASTARPAQQSVFARRNYDDDMVNMQHSVCKRKWRLTCA